MNCHEAREGVSALGVGLTERALVHAHVMQCVECRKERESLPQVVSSRQRVAPSRAAWLTRLLVLLSISFTVSVRAARRVIAASRVGAMRILDLLIRVRSLPPLRFALSERAAVKAMGATGAVGRIVVASSSRARPLLKVCTGIVSLAVLIAAILALWPRQWPDNLMPRFSAGERLSRDVRLPVDRKPAELAVAAPLVKTSTPKPVSAPQPATQTEIPASLRRPDPALAQSRATAFAPMPSTEAAQNAEALDSTAAIDWLLKVGSSRRRIENP